MFKSQNFCHIASNNRNNVKVGVFVYRTTDNLATVTANGYFNDRIIDINLHDLIIHEQINALDNTKVERNLLCVTERTLENVGTSVVKSKWEEDIEQYIEDAFVKKDGSSVMTGPLLMRATDDFKCAIAPYWDGVGFFKLNNNNSVTLMASLEYTDGFTPAANNTYNIGTNVRKWKNLYLSGVAYLSKINNGYDIAVPVTSSADTLALKSQVDDAANSGEQLYTTGVWYAKMYAATVVPTGAEYDGRNYADFSQVDSDNNPIIVIYTGASGAWTETARITPPANHNGYLTITSKIWDIAEQSGQQGGSVLWSWNNKTFTPYPRIVSFESINITGNSTVTMPGTLTDNSIPNKKYVDDAVAGAHYHPDLFSWQWADHELDNTQWVRADTYSWQDGTVYEEAYQHLVSDMAHTGAPDYVWNVNISDVIYYRDTGKDVSGETYQYAYTSFFANTVQTIYAASAIDSLTTSKSFYDGPTSSATLVASVSGQSNFSRDNIYIPQRDTIAGIDVLYYTATDGHKYTLANQESNVSALYTATGVAWYYIIDTTNQRFKLPRTQFGVTGYRDGVGNYVDAGLPNITGTFNQSAYGNIVATGAFGTTSNSSNCSSGGDDRPVGTFDASRCSSIYGNSTTVQPKATQMYLYFYVGTFTQTALENTAGLNAELFNNKADIDLNNVSAGIDFVVASQAPTALNNYTWYRKYKSGWVEQGGTTSLPDTTGAVVATLPVEMADTNYSVTACPVVNDGTWISAWIQRNSTTQISVDMFNAVGGRSKGTTTWEVKGFAA